MSALIVISLWAVFGSIWTYWFVNYFLDDQKFSDMDRPPGGLMLFWMVFASPAMASLMAIFFVVEAVKKMTSNREKPSLVQRLFGIKEK